MSDRDHDPGLEAILRTDRFVDALAEGARMSSVDPLSAMLAGWRDEVRSRPDDHVVTLAQASAAFAGSRQPPRRKGIGLAVVGAAAAALLVLGGLVTIGSDALFGEPPQTRTGAVVLAAQSELAQVQQLVEEGKWDEAQERLVDLGPTVQSVDDEQSRQQLVEQYNNLTVQVVERDPQATLPPPGTPLPILPSSPLTFLPPPVVDVTVTTPSPTPSEVLLAPSPTPSGPLPTPTGPLPTPTTPLPTPTGQLPTPTGPIPTPTGPIPTPTGQLPTPTGPIPTPSGQLPTPTGQLPTPTGPIPTPSARVTTSAQAPATSGQAVTTTPQTSPSPTPTTTSEASSGVR